MTYKKALQWGGLVLSVTGFVLGQMSNKIDEKKKELVIHEDVVKEVAKVMAQQQLMIEAKSSEEPL